MNTWMNERTNELMNEYTIERTNEWIHEWMNERIIYWIYVHLKIFVQSVSLYMYIFLMIAKKL